MTTVLAKQIAARMKAKNISTITLEREAGLKAHMVRNILRGFSRRPRIDIVHSIARILECTVDDLLQGQDIFTDDETGETRKELLTHEYKPGLLMDTLKLIDSKVKQGKHHLTNQQLLTCIEEVFVYSLQKNSKGVDEDFVDWFMDMVAEGN